MDLRCSAQDILLCDLFQISALQNHCEVCVINLCKTCVGEHLSDSSKRHNVVPYKHRASFPKYPRCSNHTKNDCELYCEKCDIPVCSTCISSRKHKGHILSDSLQRIQLKRKILEEDLNELEKTIYPVYEEFEIDFKSKNESFEEYYEKLITAITNQEDNLLHKIKTVFKEKLSEIGKMKNKHRGALDKQEKEIKHITSDVKHNILELKEILDSDNVSLISGYKSRNAEFRCLPPKVNISPPRFSTHWIRTEQLHQMFGSLSALSITKDEHGFTIEAPKVVSCPPDKPLLDEPKRIATIQTRFERLKSIACVSDEEIWTNGGDNFVNLYNLKGKLLISIKSKSGSFVRDIAVTKRRSLLYIDYRCVCEVINEQIHEVIKLELKRENFDDWTPESICTTSSDDILVVLHNFSREQTKVVRFSHYTEKQTIQFDSEGQLLYSTDFCKKRNICENRNLDICAADEGANAVVVVNQAGKLRFRYTGPHSTSKGSFYVYGITTDSQGQILTADSINSCIHILDQEEQFLCCIYKRDLHRPWALCVDASDNLFVSERYSGIIRKIKYM